MNERKGFEYGDLPLFGVRSERKIQRVIVYIHDKDERVGLPPRTEHHSDINSSH